MCAHQGKSVLVFDSGLGGLGVYGVMQTLLADQAITPWYLADDAAFPYGDWPPDRLIARVAGVLDAAISALAPACVVIACSTASTLVLPPLRARWPQVEFVGTVPAIKPAAQRSVSKRVSVIGTPGTVSRDYTRALIADFAKECTVTLVGAPNLARLCETCLVHGYDETHVPTALKEAIAAEMAPCFVKDGARQTDVIVLACTHYPLILPLLHQLAPWPVAFLDPAPAIARRVCTVLGFDEHGNPPLPDPDPDLAPPPPAKSNAHGNFLLTRGEPPQPPLKAMLARFGLHYAHELSQALKLATALDREAFEHDRF